MCLWLLTACLGVLPAGPTQNTIVVVNQGVPTPILQPTTAAATTAAPATMPPTVAPTMPPTKPPTVAPTMPPTMATPAPTTTGSPPIDPRVGTTPAASANLQQPDYNMAVRFPRQKRSFTFKPASIKELLNKLSVVNDQHKMQKRQTSCSCVAAGTCPNAHANIDVRIVTPGGSQCPSGHVYCCTGSTAQIACGTLQSVPAPSVTPTAGQASYGEYPWQALVLSLQNDYIAGGVLIDQLNVLTVTHRLTSYVQSGTAPNVKVRLGEWDAAGTYEPLQTQEYTVAKVFSHPSYNQKTLQYDLTILRLSSAVPFSPTSGSLPTVNRACLPPSSTSTYTGQRCWVSGWGKDMFGATGQYQQILKEVDVTMVAPATCQSELQTARLGPSYVLDTTSFVCAGGEANKDACTGDGGSGLVCQVNGQWVVVGLVSWGLGCAMPNVPGVYVNVAGLLPWIQQIQATA